MQPWQGYLSGEQRPGRQHSDTRWIISTERGKMSRAQTDADEDKKFDDLHEKKPDFVISTLARRQHRISFNRFAACATCNFGFRLSGFAWSWHFWRFLSVRFAGASAAIHSMPRLAQRLPFLFNSGARICWGG
jgi:hypothetical protein